MFVVLMIHSHVNSVADICRIYPEHVGEVGSVFVFQWEGVTNASVPNSIGVS